MVVREGNNVTLQCAATGFPPPTIVWKREQGEPIPLSNGKEGRPHAAGKIVAALKAVRSLGLVTS